MWTAHVADAGLAVPAAELHPGEAGGHLAFQPAASAVPHLNPPSMSCPLPQSHQVWNPHPPHFPSPQLYPLPTPSLQYTHTQTYRYTRIVLAAVLQPPATSLWQWSFKQSLLVSWRCAAAAPVMIRLSDVGEKCTKSTPPPPPPSPTHTHTLRENH